LRRHALSCPRAPAFNSVLTENGDYNIRRNVGTSTYEVQLSRIKKKNMVVNNSFIASAQILLLVYFEGADVDTETTELIKPKYKEKRN
jgi:hypothetical protein